MRKVSGTTRAIIGAGLLATGTPLLVLYIAQFSWVGIAVCASLIGGGFSLFISAYDKAVLGK